jgi:uridine phosphorylase
LKKQKAWYLGCSKEQIAERVVLLGDPGRVQRLCAHLDDVQHFPVNRGLATATGSYHGVPITLAAFGMGAPIAAIVLHELADLGSSVFLRIGTSIGLPPVEIGDIVIADSAVIHEGTSKAYLPDGSDCRADSEVVAALTRASELQSVRTHIGSFASYDGFYRDMFALDAASESRVASNFEDLTRHGVLAIDMETSAILTVGGVLGCKVGSLCVSSVNSLTKHKMSLEEQTASEEILINTALQALVSVGT